MKLSKVKFLFVMLCLFCLIEQTGISVLSMVSHVKVMVTDQAEKQANDAGESREVKQAEIKEYWALSPDASGLLTSLAVRPVLHPRETSRQHYNWHPPVQNPPPNFNA